MTQAITEEMKVHEEWYEKAKTITTADLPEFVRSLTEDYQHDYGTICHAVTAAALAAAHAVDHSPTGGITGFQGGAIMWEFICRWQSLQGQPLRLVKYADMLFPQYEAHFEKTISSSTWKYLQEGAQKHLDSRSRDNFASGSVIDHWHSIVAGVVPFGYVVTDAR